MRAIQLQRFKHLGRILEMARVAAILQRASEWPEDQLSRAALSKAIGSSPTNEAEALASVTGVALPGIEMDTVLRTADLELRQRLESGIRNQHLLVLAAIDRLSELRMTSDPGATRSLKGGLLRLRDQYERLRQASAPFLQKTAQEFGK